MKRATLILMCVVIILLCSVAMAEDCECVTYKYKQQSHIYPLGGASYGNLADMINKEVRSGWKVFEIKIYDDGTIDGGVNGFVIYRKCIQWYCK